MCELHATYSKPLATPVEPSHHSSVTMTPCKSTVLHYAFVVKAFHAVGSVCWLLSRWARSEAGSSVVILNRRTNVYSTDVEQLTLNHPTNGTRCVYYLVAAQLGQTRPCLAWTPQGSLALLLHYVKLINQRAVRVGKLLELHVCAVVRCQTSVPGQRGSVDACDLVSYGRRTTGVERPDSLNRSSSRSTAPVQPSTQVGAHAKPHAPECRGLESRRRDAVAVRPWTVFMKRVGSRWSTVARRDVHRHLLLLTCAQRRRVSMRHNPVREVKSGHLRIKTKAQAK